MICWRPSDTVINSGPLVGGASGAARSFSAVRARTLTSADENLMRAYACLLAAWGQPVGGIVVPGLVMLLRSFDIPVAN